MVNKFELHNSKKFTKLFGLIWFISLLYILHKNITRLEMNTHDDFKYYLSQVLIKLP